MSKSPISDLSDLFTRHGLTVVRTDGKDFGLAVIYLPDESKPNSSHKGPTIAKALEAARDYYFSHRDDEWYLKEERASVSSEHLLHEQDDVTKWHLTPCPRCGENTTATGCAKHCVMCDCCRVHISDAREVYCPNCKAQDDGITEERPSIYYCDNCILYFSPIARVITAKDEDKILADNKALFVSERGIVEAPNLNSMSVPELLDTEDEDPRQPSPEETPKDSHLPGKFFPTQGTVKQTKRASNLNKLRRLSLRNLDSISNLLDSVHNQEQEIESLKRSRQNHAKFIEDLYDKTKQVPD
jgi:hypothetical protein